MPANAIAFRDRKWAAYYDRRKLQMVLERMKYPADGEGVYIYVTHDMTVLPLLAYLSGWREVFLEQFPGYLQGLALQRREGLVALVS